VTKVCIIGSGFVGLAAALALLPHVGEIVIFEEGETGASQAATGLLHPYPGLQGRRSLRATEAMEKSLALLAIAEEELGRPVAHRGGIVKIGAIASPEGDVERIGENHYFIRSGVTVFPRLYLEGLRRVIVKRGGRFVTRTIASLGELAACDLVVLAAGAGVFGLAECRHLALGAVKGQVLRCRLETAPSCSRIERHATVLTEEPGVCDYGATYERTFVSEGPSVERATALLGPPGEVMGCRSGVRVTRRGHYFPLTAEVAPGRWVVTGFGSRGLLYHALVTEELTQALFRQ
jgi:glycine/D-amino acid oxidase-like deaminating enzyme